MSERLYESLPCPLEDLEVMWRGESVAKIHLEQIEVDEDLQAAKDAHKQLTKSNENHRNRLLREISQRAEYREVEVEHQADFVANVMRVVRTDTGEEVRSRALREDEKQTVLELRDPKEQEL